MQTERSFVSTIVVGFIICGVAGCGRNAEPALEDAVSMGKRCDHAMRPFVTANAQLLFVTLTGEEHQYTRFNKNCALRGYIDRDKLGDLYDLVRCLGILAAAAELRNGKGLDADLTTQELEVVLDASDRARIAILAQLRAFDDGTDAGLSRRISTVADRLSTIKSESRNWAGEEALLARVSEIQFGPEKAKTLNPSEASFYGIDELILGDVAQRELEARSVSIIGVSRFESYGVPAMIRHWRNRIPALIWPMVLLAIESSIAPEIAGQLTEARNRFGLDKFVVLK